MIAVKSMMFFLKVPINCCTEAKLTVKMWLLKHNKKISLHCAEIFLFVLELNVFVTNDSSSEENG